MSLRRRVVIAFVFVAAVLVVTNAALASTLRSFLVDRLDRQLVAATSTLVERRGMPGRAPCLGLGGGAREETLSEYSISCIDTERGVMYSFDSPLREQEPRIDPEVVIGQAADRGEPPEAFSVAGQTGGRWRLVSIRTPQGSIAVVGVPLDQLELTLRRIRFLQVVSTSAVLIALALVLWWMVRLGVHPLERMAKTAGAIAAGDLSRRVDDVDQRTEAGRLGSAFNSMLERISDAFRAREASEARVRRFAADASHELRTPLTSIRGYAELWRAGGLRDEADLADAMRRMEQEATRMGALVDDLLLLARLDQDRPIEHRPVRLDRLAADGVRDAKAVEPDRAITIETERVVVDGDEPKLRQVVGNLLANARVHTPRDAAVRVKVIAAGDRARLEVADEGPGMTADVAAKVFERFYRADTSRAREGGNGGGTGLGLSIVEAVAHAHGGHASVRSSPGRGTTFVVELPLTSPSANGETPPTDANEPVAPTS